MKVEIGPYPDPQRQPGLGRLVRVDVDKDDIYSLYATLAHIIHPSLVRFRDEAFSIAYVDNEDVPKELHGDQRDDQLLQERWNWVLGEMIFAMDSIINDKPDYKANSDEEILAEESRIANGCRLFGKYFQALWI